MSSCLFDVLIQNGGLWRGVPKCGIPPANPDTFREPIGRALATANQQRVAFSECAGWKKMQLAKCATVLSKRSFAEATKFKMS